jgi:hypothetical protein
MPKFIVERVENGQVTLRVPGCNYANTFLLPGAAPAAVVSGARVRGGIHAPAWKVDCVELGGNYVEPLVGRPRRMQGTIVAVNAVANELTVQVGYEVIVILPARYNAGKFQVGQRVGWDNLEIPTFQLETSS